MKSDITQAEEHNAICGIQMMNSAASSLSLKQLECVRIGAVAKYKELLADIIKLEDILNESIAERMRKGETNLERERLDHLKRIRNNIKEEEIAEARNGVYSFTTPHYKLRTPPEEED